MLMLFSGGGHVEDNLVSPDLSHHGAILILRLRPGLLLLSLALHQRILPFNHNLPAACVQ